MWDDENVVFADIASPITIGNLRHNPFIEINMVDPFLRRGFRFKGRAEVFESGPEFDFVSQDLWTPRGPSVSGQRRGQGERRGSLPGAVARLHLQRQRSRKSRSGPSGCSAMASAQLESRNRRLAAARSRQVIR